MQFGGLSDREYFFNHHEQLWKEHSVKPQGGELRAAPAQRLIFKRMCSPGFIYFPPKVPMVTRPEEEALCTFSTLNYEDKGTAKEWHCWH